MDDKRDFKRICVFCGAGVGTDPVYEQGAVALGKELVARKIGLVYGGGTVGLMGAIATTVEQGLGAKGVFGVIPEALAPREISNAMIGETHTVPDMHTRKAMMARHADAFIAMPGGLGTLEELLEVMTWQQLGFHGKPIGLLNTNGFYDPLLQLFGHLREQGFVKPSHGQLVVSAHPAELIDQLGAFQVPPSLINMKLASRTAVGEDISQPAPEDDRV